MVLAATESPTLSPTVTIIVALISASALVLGPVLIALINRAPKAQAAAPDPDKVMPRAEYDLLLEQLARLDDENDRLARENTRLREAETVRRIEDDRRGREQTP